MSISDTAQAKKYSSVAEVAAAQAKKYALELETAPNYAAEAQASAEAAASSSQSASQFASNASASAASSQQSANSAATSAQEAAEAASGAINQTVRAPDGEALTALPDAASRGNSFIVTGNDGDVSILSRDSVPVLDVDGKLPVSVIPSIALTEPFVVSGEAAMLALDAQPGDIAKRTDLGYSFCLAASPASTLSNWVQLTDDVLSQLGQSSGATQVGATSPSGSSSTVQAELNAKAKAGANSDISSLSGLTTPLSSLQGGAGSCALMATLNDAASSSINATVNYIITNGYRAAGDGGGATYIRVTSQPSHPGKFQSADGAWWEFDGPEINLFQAGALGDSTSGMAGSGTDNTTFFTNAIAIAVAKGIAVIVPALAPGKAFRLASSISSQDAFSLIGCGADVTVTSTYNTPNGGSWIFFDHAGIGISYRDDTTPANSKKFARIQGVGFDRVQATPGAGWTPSAALEDIHVEFNVDMDDVFFLKSSRCAKIRSAGQLQTRRVRGQALVIGFECERSSDVQRWDGDHWWPYWTQDVNVITYTKQNSYCYSVRRADGLMIDSPFGIFYKRVFYASDASGDGSGLANFHLRNLYADIGGGGIEINSNYYSAYGTIEGYLCNSDVGGNGTDGAAFRLAGAVASKIKLSMRSNRSPEEVVYVSGSAHKVTLNLTYANGWAFVTSGRYAIKATDGAVIENLNMPDLTTGNSLYYSKDTISQITFKGYYDLTGSLASPRGFHGTRVSIADDAVAIIAAPSANLTAIMTICPASVPAAGNPAGNVWLRATASPSAANMSLTTTTNVSITTGILSGTTGTDGNLTISSASDGNFYIENRTGASRSFDIILFGS